MLLRLLFRGNTSIRVIALLALFAVPATMRAGCGSVESVCQAFADSTIAFRGRLLKETDMRPVSPLPPGVIVGMGDPPRDFDFEVLEVFRGNPGPQITVRATAGAFTVGGEFLVFASTNAVTNLLTAPGCLINPRADSPEYARYLAWLRGDPNKPPAVWIFGATTMSVKQEDVPPVTITLEGTENLAAVTGRDHRYEFDELLPGTYTIAASPPAGYLASLLSAYALRETGVIHKDGDQTTVTVTLPAKSCAQVDWVVSPAAHAAGSAIGAAVKQAVDPPAR
jgi:hypothetical protein